MVAQRTARWDQGGEGQGIGTHHPFQARGGEVKLVLQRRKGNAYDHDIEHHHDLSSARHGKRKPLPGRCTQSHDSTVPHKTASAPSWLAGTSRDENGERVGQDKSS